jgi:prepilin-type N-terminal cleavage/methylation domain-containing protein
MIHSANNNEDGFTLIEVLISFVILAGAIVLTFQVFGDGLRGLHAAQARAKSISIARAQIDQVALSSTLSEGTTTGTTEGETWRIVVRAIKSDETNTASLLRLFKIEAFEGAAGQDAPPLLETIILARPSSP